MLEQGIVLDNGLGDYGIGFSVNYSNAVNTLIIAITLTQSACGLD